MIAVALEKPNHAFATDLGLLANPRWTAAVRRIVCVPFEARYQGIGIAVFSSIYHR